MEPNKFRESRVAINRKVEKIDDLIEQKEVEASKEKFEKVSEELEALKPEAEGEIQERSVKNLGIRINHLAVRIKKLKTKKSTARKSGGSVKSQISWDEARVAELSRPYLQKVMENMGADQGASVLLGTTGKGIRPNYRIQYSDGQVKGFTGSGHKPQENLSASQSKNLSDPFAYGVVKAILDKG